VTLSVFPADQTMTVMVLFQIPTWHSLRRFPLRIAGSL